MQKLIAALFAAALCAAPALAQDKKEMTPQQQRMSDCSKQASDKGMKGDDRNKFMSTCLKGEQPMTQQEKMTACNKEASAKAMKGDDRKKFMSSCLSG
jgi:psiF repeat